MQTKTKKTIKELPGVERPREKLMQYGPEKLSNSELLAIILRSGRKGENVIELANKILKRFSKDELPNLTFNDIVVKDGFLSFKEKNYAYNQKLHKTISTVAR